MPPLSIRRACREHAANALKRQTRDFQRLGILGEWENPYQHDVGPLRSRNSAAVRALRRARLSSTKARDPSTGAFTIRRRSPKLRSNIDQHTSPSVYVKFPLESDPAQIDPALAGRKVFVLIWTTTPWTLPANLGIAVHPDFEYVAFESGDEVYIVAAELLGASSRNVNWRSSDCSRKCSRVFPAQNSIGWKPHPWIDRPSLLMVGEHVTLGGEADAETELDVSEARDKSATTKAGTGCVHTAPGHGHDDFVIGKTLRAWRFIVRSTMPAASLPRSNTSPA